jgi:hypothetical protein
MQGTCAFGGETVLAESPRTARPYCLVPAQ